MGASEQAEGGAVLQSRRRQVSVQPGGVDRPGVAGADGVGPERPRDPPGFPREVRLLLLRCPARECGCWGGYSGQVDDLCQKVHLSESVISPGGRGGCSSFLEVLMGARGHLCVLGDERGMRGMAHEINMHIKYGMYNRRFEWGLEAIW